MDVKELVSLGGGPQYVAGKEAMAKRARAKELAADAHQLIADAEALETAARQLANMDS